MSQSTYLTLSQQQRSELKKRKISLKMDYFLIIGIGFFMGQAQTVGFYPLTLIYLSMVSSYNIMVFSLSFITVSITLLWSGNFLAFPYLIAGLIGSTVYYIFREKFNLDIALINSIIYLVLSLANNFYNDNLMVFFIITFIESILIYILSYISIRGIQEIVDKTANLTKLALITIFIISIGTIIGLANMPIANTFLINILVYIFLFSTSSIIGFNYAIIIAVVYGLVLSNTGIVPLVNMYTYIILSFSVALFTGKKKLWVPVGALLAILLYSGLAPTMQHLQETALQIIISLTIFMIIPYKYWEKAYSSLVRQKSIEKNEINSDVNIRLKQHLHELSQVFNQLSITFKENIPMDSVHRELEDFSFIFRSKVCGKCKRRDICWHQEKDDTLKRVFLLMNAGKSKGYLTEDNIKKFLREKCLYTDRIISLVKVSFEIFQINTFWRNRLSDKQKVVSEQLSGIGDTIEQFSLKSSPAVTRGSILAQIKQKAKINDIDLYNIELHSNLNCKKDYFTVEMEQCSGNCPCEEQFTDLLSSEYEHNYRIIGKTCGSKIKNKSCKITYGPVGEYQLSISHVLKACNNDTSGDSFLYKGLKDGKDLVVISDGMGVGEKAAIESRTAINLLESIIDAGFDQKVAVKTINSALYLRNQEESFTTLDICIFDTFTGKMIFNKIGAVASYIKREWELIKVNSASLPVGILDNIEVSTQEMEMMPGDFVIMLTDGMMDIRDDIDDKEEWLRQILQNSSFDNTDEMLNYILDVVLDFNGNISDDMTIVIVKVEEILKKRRKIKGLPRINIR
ncbi:MAG: SpoIIE family protein phosphatase [Halanaerobiaceae bacterium]